MVALATWSGKSRFSYTGSVKNGTRIIYGNNNEIFIRAEDYTKLLEYFKGLSVEIGTSRDNPPRGSMGEWLLQNVTKTAVASYVGPILIEEGFADKTDKTAISFKIFTCAELVKNPNNVDKVKLSRFDLLHPDGRNLILSWFDRAWEMRNYPDGHFEAFIHAWISFNGWAACVTGIDTDRKWLNALMLDKTMWVLFNKLASDEDVSKELESFHKLWPIFRAQAIRRRGIHGYGFERSKLVERYFDEGIKSFEPQCYKRHLDEKEEVPLDWPHTIAAIYRVRCNLFHGEKARTFESDHTIVSSAFKVLISIEKELFNK